MPEWRTFLSRPWALAIVPLIFFPLMINVRVFPFIAPNEEPKWALLTICFVLIAIAAAAWLWQRRDTWAISLHWSFFALLGFYTLLFIGIWIGPNTTEGLIRFAFWSACLAVWLSVLYGIKNLPLYSHVACWIISLGSLVFSIRYWFSYVLDYGKPGYNISVLFSPIGHINFTGDVLVILAPVLAWMLGFYKQPVLRILNWVSLFSILTMLLVASSRGALGGIVIGFVVMALVAARHYRLALNTNWRIAENTLPVALIASAIIASILTYYNLPYHYRDLARFSAESQGTTVESGHLTPGAPQPPLAEFWDKLRPILGQRTPIYGSSSAMIADAPWLGQGTGNFFTVYPAYSNRFPDFRDPLSSARTFTTNPHNVLLQIATQNGIPALLLFCSLLLLLWARLIHALWQQWNVWLATGLTAITAALFDAMFNHVFFNPASMFVFALMGAWWWGSLPASPAARRVELPATIQKPIAGALLITVALLSIWPTRWIISEYHAGLGMAYMQYPALAATANQKAYNWDQDNFRAVFGVAQAAYQEKRFDDCIAYMQHFEKIYPYNAPALNMLAAAYMMTSRFTEAKAVLERTLAVLPDFDMAQENLNRINTILQQQQNTTSSVPYSITQP